MMEFFKPWRRKIGVVTLLMALVAMGGWMRSLIVYDLVEFQHVSYGIIPWSSNTVSSSDGRIRLRVATGRRDRQGNISNELNWHTNQSIDNWMWGVAVEPQWQSWGLYLGTGIQPVPNNPKHFFLKIHYGAIVLPLTLISAFLFLKKQKTSTPKKTPEPILDEGGVT